MMVIRVAVRAPLMMIISLIFAFQVNAKLSVMYLCAIPVLGIALFSIQRFAHPIFEKVFHIYDKLNMVVQENLSGIRVVKSFVREDHEVDKFSKVSKDIYKNFAKAEKIVAFNMPIMQFTMYVCMILGFMVWREAHSIRRNDHRRAFQYNILCGNDTVRTYDALNGVCNDNDFTGVG